MMSSVGILLVSLARVAQLLPEPPLGTSNIGYIIVAIILSPALILVVASLLGKPRKRSITILFLGILSTMFVLFIVATYLLGIITGIFF